MCTIKLGLDIQPKPVKKLKLSYWAKGTVFTNGDHVKVLLNYSV
jgi:hypothetical protein